MQPPQPHHEQERVAELHGLAILDTLPEQAYDDLTFLAAQICDTPIALMSLVDEDRQWFKSKLGLDADETGRDVAFCAYAITAPDEIMVVPNATEDDRFAANPLVLDDPSIRFYAGAPLVMPSGNALGTLCVIDRKPRDLTPDQAKALEALARQVMAQLELRLSVQELESAADERLRYHDQLEAYQQRLEEQLSIIAHQSVTDPLTGLKNRRALIDRIEDELARHERYGSPLSIALIDVDRFKVVNDRHGHLAGDQLLKALADVLDGNARDTDVVARYGGEEFAVLLTNTDAGAAYVLAERMRRRIEDVEWQHMSLTVSIGVATLEGPCDAETLLHRADRALYQAKEAGRNRVVAASAA